MLVYTLSDDEELGIPSIAETGLYTGPEGVEGVRGAE